MSGTKSRKWVHQNPTNQPTNHANQPKQMSKKCTHVKMEGFDLLFEGQANGVIPVYKYRSKTTGLTVVLAQVEGPLVNGYFCLGVNIYITPFIAHPPPFRSLHFEYRPFRSRTVSATGSKW